MLQAASNLSPSEAALPNQIHELNSKVSQKWFGDSDMRLARVGVHGDGSCFYHSVCFATNREDYVHQSEAMQKDIAYRYRCSMADELDAVEMKKIIKRTTTKSPKSKKELRDELCNPRVWADETAIRLFSKASGLNVIFLDMSKAELYCGVHHDDALSTDIPDTLVVLWITHSHFEPLAEIVSVGDHVSEIRAVFQPSKSKADAVLVNTLMSKYATQCKLKRK